MRLVLAPNLWKESKKNSSNHEIKNQAKNTLKITKMKTLQHNIGDDLTQSTAILMQIKSLQGGKTATTSSHSLEDWRDLSLSLIFSLTP
jgi:hypothetical protein